MYGNSLAKIGSGLDFGALSHDVVRMQVDGDAMPRSPRRAPSAPVVSPPEPPGVLADVDVPERVRRLTPLARKALAVRPGAELFDPGEIAVLPASGTANELPLSRPRLEELLRAALAVADDTPSVVWVRGDSEIAVHAARTRVALGPGTLVVGVRVETDQTGPAEVSVPFALGSPELAAGLVMAAPTRPDGPPLLVEQWGDVVVAAVYRALLDVVTAAAATAGVDADGRPLLPGAVASDGETLRVVPQARHAIDRRQLL